MSDADAIKNNLGGEIICRVFWCLNLEKKKF
jgi:hypothetical protein